MKALKVVLAVAVLAVAAWALGRFFVLQLHAGRADGGPPGVLLAAPPEYTVTEGGEMERTEAAARLARLLAERPDTAHLALHFSTAGTEIYWLADRGDPGAARLVERSAGPSGVRVETTWKGGLVERLAWARGHGDPEAPGLPPGERRNLYH